MMVIKKYINELLFFIGNIAIIILNDLITNKIILYPIVLIATLGVIYSIYRSNTKGAIKHIIIGLYIFALVIYSIGIVGAL